MGLKELLAERKVSEYDRGHKNGIESTESVIEDLENDIEELTLKLTDLGSIDPERFVESLDNRKFSLLMDAIMDRIESKEEILDVDTTDRILNYFV